MRKCGRCRLCCKLFTIPELEKYGGEQCPHCNTIMGCKIYEMRPAACRDFQYLWLQEKLPQNWRPDLINVVFRHCFTLDGIPLITAHELYRGAVNKLDLSSFAKAGVGVAIFCDEIICEILGPITLTEKEAGIWCHKAVSRLLEQI